MKDYRQFLNESTIDNAGVLIAQYLSSQGYGNQIIVNTEESKEKTKGYYEIENGKTKTIWIVAENDKTRIQDKITIQKILDDNNISYSETPLSNHSKTRTDISKKDSGIGKKLNIMYKYLTKTIAVQELFVGALVMQKKEYGEINFAKTDELIKKLTGYFSKIKGIDDVKKYIIAAQKNYSDLSPSISSSNSILKIIGDDGQTPVTAYWPAKMGNKWIDEIAFLNPQIGGIKTYNSSDIIFKTKGIKGEVFYGFSLKKKAKETDLDPTLINKAITGKDSFLKGIVSDSDLDEIENSKLDFFRYAVGAEENGISIENASTMSRDDLKGPILDMDKNMHNHLKSSENVFFKKIDEILPKYSQDFAKAFLDLIFKPELANNIATKDFKFNLNTGIGAINVNGIAPKAAINLDLDSTIEVLTGLYDTKLDIVQTENKKQAWELDAGASKIFYTLTSDGIPIMNIEIRYKGNFIANPQFQAVANVNFKNLFK